MNLKSFFLKLGCILTIVTLSVPFIAAEAMNDPDGVTIILQPKDDELHDAPRSIVPFFAAYYESLSAVMLGCNDSIGDVTVTLESTAGDWYQTVFDTSDGVILVPASGLSGYYVLTIETADHTVYEGEFNL